MLLFFFDVIRWIAFLRSSYVLVCLSWAESCWSPAVRPRTTMKRALMHAAHDTNEASIREPPYICTIFSIKYIHILLYK